MHWVVKNGARANIWYWDTKYVLVFSCTGYLERFCKAGWQWIQIIAPPQNELGFFIKLSIQFWGIWLSTAAFLGEFCRTSEEKCACDGLCGCLLKVGQLVVHSWGACKKGNIDSSALHCWSLVSEERVRVTGISSQVACFCRSSLV